MPTNSPLQDADAQNKKLIGAMKAENKKLSNQLVKIQAQHFTLKAKFAATEKELNSANKRIQSDRISAIRMIVVHPEVTCPFCTRIFTPERK